MTQSLVQGIIDALSGSVGKEAIVFIISMIPILELRGALLVAGRFLECRSQKRFHYVFLGILYRFRLSCF